MRRDLDLVVPPPPPTQVRVQVEDVNESPQFPSEVYKASIFSIAPYKSPVVYVKVNTSVINGPK